MQESYSPRRPARSRFMPLRGLDHHLLEWSGASAHEGPPLVLLHGWMDVAASFQFMVDAMRNERHVLALDWRGFGRTGGRSDSYWFPDYLADLDALLDAVSPDAPVDLLGHSMGGNVAMLYAGVRPQRVRRLVNLEGFGMPDTRAAQAPSRLAQWLDELKAPATLTDYDSRNAVARRLLRNDPFLTPDKAAWLAGHWAEAGADGRWTLRADPAHKHVNPVLYRQDEALACWRRITAPVLWIEGAQTQVLARWGARYPREDFEQRIAEVPNLRRELLADCGHMLHHDRPEAVAALVEAFLD